MNHKTVRLAKMGMLVAVSIVLVYFVHFPIFPAVAFLEYDPADIPILMGTFAFGPLAGVLLTVVTSVVQGVTAVSYTHLVPRVGLSRAANMLRRVVFPEPDSPIIATYSPFSTEKDTLLSACTLLAPKRVVYIFFRLFTSKMAIRHTSFCFVQYFAYVKRIAEGKGVCHLFVLDRKSVV